MYPFTFWKLYNMLTMALNIKKIERGLNMIKVSFIGISVKDINISVDFYSNVLQDEHYERFDTPSGAKCAIFRLEDKVVQLIQRPNRGSQDLPTGPLDHLGFEVVNLEHHIMRLKEIGVKLLYDDIKIGPKTKWMMFEGPDGERLEFLEWLK